MLHKINKILSLLLCFLLIFEQSGFAQVAGQLDIAGHIALLRTALTLDKFRPLHLRYLSYDNLNNNFKLLLDKGDLKGLGVQELESSTKILLQYFFIGISLPNETFWVNLRPDSPDQIIDDALATTDAGKILLEADLQLKRDTARLTSPETPEGKEYWDKLYKKAEEIFGSSNITIPTLTRPWIVPGEIIIREAQDNAYIYKATLKVMLEQDYLKGSATYNFQDERLKTLNEYSSQLIRELIIPKLTKEVNISKRYAPLRQVYYSLIFAQWFKSRFYGKGDLYSRLIDQKNLNGLTSQAPWSKTTYFKEYQKSFKEGEYNIKEPIHTPFGQTIRSYFSGGIAFGKIIPSVTAASSLQGESLPQAAGSPFDDVTIIKGKLSIFPAGRKTVEAEARLSQNPQEPFLISIRTNGQLKEETTSLAVNRPKERLPQAEVFLKTTTAAPNKAAGSPAQQEEKESLSGINTLQGRTTASPIWGAKLITTISLTAILMFGPCVDAFASIADTSRGLFFRKQLVHKTLRALSTDKAYLMDYFQRSVGAVRAIGVNVELNDILALMLTETDFNPRTSKAGAETFMQITEAAARLHGERVEYLKAKLEEGKRLSRQEALDHSIYRALNLTSQDFAWKTILSKPKKAIVAGVAMYASELGYFINYEFAPVKNKKGKVIRYAHRSVSSNNTITPLHLLNTKYLAAVAYHRGRDGAIEYAKKKGLFAFGNWLSDSGRQARVFKAYLEILSDRNAYYLLPLKPAPENARTRGKVAPAGKSTSVSSSLKQKESAGSPLEQAASSAIEEGVSRRNFLKWIGASAGTLAVPPMFKTVASAETQQSKERSGKFNDFKKYEAFITDNLPEDLKSLQLKKVKAWNQIPSEDKQEKEKAREEYRASRNAIPALLKEKYTLYRAHSKEAYLVPIKNLFEKSGFKAELDQVSMVTDRRALAVVFVDRDSVYDGRVIKDRGAIEAALLEKKKADNTRFWADMSALAKFTGGMLAIAAPIVGYLLWRENRDDIIRKYNVKQVKKSLQGGKFKIEAIEFFTYRGAGSTDLLFLRNARRQALSLSTNEIEISKTGKRLGRLNRSYEENEYRLYCDKIIDAASAHLLNKKQRIAFRLLQEKLNEQNKTILSVTLLRMLSNNKISSETLDLEGALLQILREDFKYSEIYQAALGELFFISNISNQANLYKMVMYSNANDIIAFYADREKELIEKLVGISATIKYYNNLRDNAQAHLTTLLDKRPDLLQWFLADFKPSTQEGRQSWQDCVIKLASEKPGVFSANRQLILERLNPDAYPYATEIKIILDHLAHPEFLLKPLLKGAFNDTFKAPGLDMRKLTVNDFISKFTEEVLKDEKIDNRLKEQLVESLLNSISISILPEGVLRAIHSGAAFRKIFIDRLSNEFVRKSFELEKLKATLEVFNPTVSKEIQKFLSHLYSSRTEERPDFLMPAILSGSLDEAFHDYGEYFYKFLKKVFESKNIETQLKKQFIQEYFVYFSDQKDILSELKPNEELTKFFRDYLISNPGKFWSKLETILEVFNPEIFPYAEGIKVTFERLDSPSFLVEALLEGHLNDALNKTSGHLLEAIKSQPEITSKLVGYLDQNPAAFFKNLETLLKVFNPALYSEEENVEAILHAIDKPSIFIPQIFEGSLNDALVSAKGRMSLFVANALGDKKVDTKFKTQLLKELSGAMVARALEINIKLARYLKEKAESCEKTLERLSDPGFKIKINEIAYNLNREITLHPAEKRLGEDQKNSLFDLLFTISDIGRAKEIFDTYFRNEPTQYEVPISDLDTLLQYISIDKIKGLIRTVVDDPKQSLDEITKNIKEQLKGQVDAQFIVRRIEWVLSNLFVLQQKIEEIEPITQAVQKQGKNTQDLRLILQEIDKANKLAELNKLATDNNLNIVDVVKFKLESIAQETRENMLADAFLNLDSSTISEQGKEELSAELSAQFGFQPAASKNRIYGKLLFNQSTDNSIISNIIGKLKSAGKIEGPKKTVFAKKFLSQNRDILTSNGLIFQYLEAIDTLQGDTQKKKEAWKQIRSLYQDRKYAQSKLRDYPEPITETISGLSGQLELPAPAIQIPHVFFEALLAISPDKSSFVTIRQLIASMNANKQLRDQLATLKNKLHEQIVFLSGFKDSYRQKGELLAKLLEAIRQKSGEPSVSNSDSFYNQLMFYLEQYSKAVGTYEKAKAHLFPETINSELEKISQTVLDSLILRGQIDDEGIDKLAKSLAGIEAEVLLARFKMGMQVKNETETLERLRNYADANANPRFAWTDHQGRNIYRLIDLYLNIIQEKEIYKDISDALNAEMGGNFKQWRYESRDYKTTIDEIIDIEVNKLIKANKVTDEEQKKIKKAKEEAQKEGVTLYEKLKKLDGFEELKNRIEQIKKQIENWEEVIRAKLDDGLVAEFTDDFYTLFNIGNYLGSTACQSCAYGGNLNRGLTGYVVNGTNKVIALLDENKRVITRRIVRLRILEDEQGNKQPAIFVEESTQFGSRGIDELYKLLDNLSQKTGLPVVASLYRPAQTTKVQQGVNKKYKIELFQGRSEFDYSDLYGNSVPGKINAGLYRQTDTLITTGLFDLLVKPASSSPVTETYIGPSAGSPMEKKAGPVSEEEDKTTSSLLSGKSPQEDDEIARPLSILTEQDINGDIVLIYDPLSAFPKIGETVLDLWPLVAGLRTKFPNTLIHIACNRSEIFSTAYFKDNKIHVIQIPSAGSVKDTQSIIDSIEYDGRNIGLMIEVNPVQFPTGMIKVKKNPHIVKLPKITAQVSASGSHRFDYLSQPLLFIDKLGRARRIKGGDTLMPGVGAWEGAFMLADILGLPKASMAVKLSETETQDAKAFLRERYENTHPNVPFDATKTILVINTLAETTQVPLSAWRTIINILRSEIKDAYFVFYANSKNQEAARLTELMPNESILLIDSSYPPEKLIGIAGAVVTPDTGFAHVSRAIYKKPTAVIFNYSPQLNSLHWLPPGIFPIPLPLTGDDEITNMGTHNFVKNYLNSSASPLALPEGASSAATSKTAASTNLRTAMNRPEEYKYLKEILERRLIENNPDTPEGRKMAQFDFEHTKRVVEFAAALAGILGADPEVVKTAALLHDVAKEPTLRGLVKHHITGAGWAEKILKDLGKNSDFIEKVKNAIMEHMGPLGKDNDKGFMASMKDVYDKSSREEPVDMPLPQSLEAIALKIADMLDLANGGVAKVVFKRQTDNVPDYFKTDGQRETLRDSVKSALGSVEAAKKEIRDLTDTLEAMGNSKDIAVNIYNVSDLIGTRTKEFVDNLDWSKIPTHQGFSEAYYNNPLIPATAEIVNFIQNGIIKSAGSPLAEQQQSASSAAVEDKSRSISDTGGIDFRVLPIVTQPMNLLLQGQSPLGTVPALRGQLPELDVEWQEIQNMLNAGIIPSSERIKDYLEACCQNGDMQRDIDKVLACIAEILRLEEERVASTESVLKELLVLLESDKPAKEMQFALAKITVLPKEPRTIGN